MSDIDVKSTRPEIERFRNLLYWLRVNAGAGEEALLGVGLYAISMIWDLSAWYVGKQVVRMMQYEAHTDFPTKYGDGARAVYDLACEVRGKFGISWVDAIMIARNVRDCEAKPVASHDIATRKAFEQAEMECIVAFMERDGIDPAHVREVMQLLT